MEKREIQIIRMMSYFVDATAQIIEEEGIDNITIRKIADIAGYNSATIYNYFEELSHLIFLAAMRYLKKYADTAPEYMARGKDPLEKYLLLWECFCKYSYREPQIYHAIFTSNIGGQPEDLLNDYYSIFPTDLMNLPEDLKPMFLESNISKRGRIALEKCIEAGYIMEDHVEDVNEMATLTWQGMHIMLLNNRRNYSVEEATEITVKYIRQIVTNANQFKL